MVAMDKDPDTDRGFLGKLGGGLKGALDGARDHLRKAGVEGAETVQMLKVYAEFLAGGDVTPDELKAAHRQMGDLGRIVAVGAPQMIPLVIVPTLLSLAVVRFGARFGVEMRPSAWISVPEHLEETVRLAEEGEGVARVRYEDGWIKRFDADGRPHCGDGPAFTNPETGEVRWFVRGTEIPSPSSAP